MKKLSGVTLLELMVAVAVLGILVSLAVPAYQEYVAQGRRPEAQQYLLQVANRLEQYYADNKAYTDDMTKLGLDADPYTTPSGYYKIDASLTSGGGYVVTATAQGSQATMDKSCKVFKVDDSGKKTASDGSQDTTSECW